jgi:hypothetical protein
MIDDTRSAPFAGTPEVAVARAGVVRLAQPRLAEEQVAYAGVLDTGMRLGMLALLLTFGVYALGLLKPHVPVDDLPRYWSLPVQEYLAAIGAQPGWAWVDLLGKGDFLNFVGVAFLSGVTILCYMAVVPIFLRKRDLAYTWLCISEVLVLALAASGLLGGGGH